MCSPARPNQPLEPCRSKHAVCVPLRSTESLLWVSVLGIYGEMPYLWYLIEMHIKMTKRERGSQPFRTKRDRASCQRVCVFVGVVFVLSSRCEPLASAIKTKKPQRYTQDRTIQRAHAFDNVWSRRTAYRLVYIFIHSTGVVFVLSVL